MKSTVDVRRIVIYLIFAYSIAWATGLVIYLTGGLVKSPTLFGTIPLAVVLLATAYMGAPALAHILTRLITREGWKGLYLQPKFKQGWRYWLICWFAPAFLVVCGMIVYFALFPQYYDPSLGTLRRLLEQRTQGLALPQIDPWTVVLSQGIFAVIAAPILNALPVLGEEFGWRAYLQPKLLPLGGRRAMLLMGLIWGSWHWPVILMGYEYGFDYPGATWLGCLFFLWFTIAFGTLIGWASLRAGSVWPAVIGHGAVNGFAAIFAFFVQGSPMPLLGPSVVGIIGSVGFALVALLILVRRGALELPKPVQAGQVAA